MSEQVIEPVDNAAELSTLRKLRDELLSTKHSQKTRITELESEVLQLSEARDNALSTVRAVTIDLPLRKLAEEMSQAPALWLREFMADYNVQADKDGSLTLQSKDGKELTFDDGKPVTVTASEVRKFLLTPNKDISAERRRTFEAITIVSRATGTIGIHSTSTTSPETNKSVAPHFGLR